MARTSWLSSGLSVVNHYVGISYGLGSITLACKGEKQPVKSTYLVYTIPSQHTSDVNSKRAFESLIDTFGSLDDVAEAPAMRIEDAIRMGGLAKTKAPRVKAVLKQIYEELGSYALSFLREMPLEEAKAWLKRLPGIGPKTAAIILCFSLGMPAMLVDTHIYRVSRRLGLIPQKATADQAHDILEPMVGPEDGFAFHLYLIRQRRQVCKT